MLLRGDIILLVVAFIWGTTFVAQHSGMDFIGPFTYAASRFFLGSVSMTVVWYLFRKQRNQAKLNNSYKSGWLSGIWGGSIMFIGLSLQQVGMLYTSTGKASFISCLYIVLVPLLSIAIKKRIAPENLLGAILAMSGLYLLSVKNGFSLESGDSIIFFSSIFGALHILFIAKYANSVDVIEMSTAQIFICFLGSLISSLLFENIIWANILEEAFPIFYGGIISVGVSYTLQIMGQKYTDPSHAAIIMSLESVFGALSSWLLLNEAMTPTELFGCALMLSGMLLTHIKLVLKKK